MTTMNGTLLTPTGDARADTVLDAIRTWSQKLPPKDRQTKYCKMASAPLVFYRGTNHLFWADFAEDERLRRFGNAETRTWIQGDLHAYNFGSFDNARGQLIYDLNDFDEALIADYQYDLWRMAVSLVLIARQNGQLSAAHQHQVIDAFSESYLSTLERYRGEKARAIYFTHNNTCRTLSDFLKSIEKTYSREGMLDRWAPEKKNGKRRLKKRKKLKKASKNEQEKIRDALDDYRKMLDNNLARDKDYFEVKAVAHRLQMGTGSLGTPRYYVLIAGPSGSQDDYRILDVKRQHRPTAYSFLGEPARYDYEARFDNHAQRHAEGYRALTYLPDPHLGWLTLDGAPYSVRKRSPYKEAFPGEVLKTHAAFSALAQQWAEILATDHARANEALPEQIRPLIDDRYPAFRALVREVAFDYATQVEADWHHFSVALDLQKGECDRQAFALPAYRSVQPR